MQAARYAKLAAWCLITWERFFALGYADRLIIRMEALPISMKVTLSISGMHCASCAQTIQKALSKALARLK